jgi:hypothetical protein
VALGGAVLGACGGGSSTSSSGINAPALPRVTGTAGGGGVQVTIDAASPLASPGAAALVQSPLGTLLVSRTAADAFLGAHRDLHPRGLRDHGLPRLFLRLPLPRLALRHQRPRAERAGLALPAAVPDAVRKRRPDDHGVSSARALIARSHIRRMKALPG